MAAALLDHRAQGRVRVLSAGTAPSDEINPVVVDVLAEIGLDVTRAFPKPLTDDLARSADIVITMGCGDTCPYYPGKTYLDWELDDPAGQPHDVVRRIRDQINQRVGELLDDLGNKEPAR
jgi:protein-tyrosine-phosphatase